MEVRIDSSCEHTPRTIEGDLTPYGTPLPDSFLAKLASSPFPPKHDYPITDAFLRCVAPDFGALWLPKDTHRPALAWRQVVCARNANQAIGSHPRVR